MFKKRLAALLLAVLMMVVVVAGCNQSKDKNEEDSSADTQNDSKTDSENSNENNNDTSAELTFPLDEQITVSCFLHMQNKATPVLQHYTEMGMFKELEEKTNIKIDFVSPPQSQRKEQFNLMLASNDLTDMIYWGWKNVPGGPGSAIEQEQIVKLNDLIDQYAPNYKKVLEDNPEWKKALTLDDGTVYMFPKIKKDNELLQTYGLQIRKDWLEKVDMEAPKNMEDWYKVLTAFKENDMNGDGDPNDEIPFANRETNILSQKMFMYAYGLRTGVNMDGFYLKDGKVEYAPVQAEYKDFLSEMNKWYDEGLIDPDYLTNDPKIFDAKVTTHKVGSYAGFVNGNLGKYEQLMAEDPSFELMPVEFPVSPDGTAYGPRSFGVVGNGMAISAGCEYKAECAAWNDYLFSEEGIKLVGYGIEGESYELVDGKCIFTDEVLNNPDVPTINAISKYTLSFSDCMGFQLWDAVKQTLSPAQTEAMQLYTSADASLEMPPASPNTEESEIIANKMGDITTYVEENYDKFLMGEKSLDEFEDYVNQINKMGIDEVKEIWQGVVDRYNSK